MEDFTEAQQKQECMPCEMKEFQVCLDNAFAKFTKANGTWRTQVRVQPKRNGKQTMLMIVPDLIGIDVDERQESLRQLMRTSNDSLGRVVQLIRATHGLSCAACQIRDSNKVRYLHEALDMIEDFQRRVCRREATENTLVER